MHNPHGTPVFRLPRRYFKFTTEICDGIDNDCDGQVDNNTTDCPRGFVCGGISGFVPE